jgi:hypothetical protein
MAGKPRGRIGRPVTGRQAGEKVSEYHQLTVRVPDADVGLLTALSGVLSRPRWWVVSEALRAFAGEAPGLSEDQRRAIRAVRRLHNPPST